MTTKKAYEELSKEGVIESIPAKGFVIKKQNNDFLREKQMLNIENKVMLLLTESRGAGMSLDELIDMIKVLSEEV